MPANANARVAQERRVRDEVFVGRYLGLNYALLSNANRNMAVLKTPQSIENQTDSSLMSWISKYTSDEQITLNYHLYFVVIRTGWIGYATHIGVNRARYNVGTMTTHMQAVKLSSRGSNGNFFGSSLSLTQTNLPQLNELPEELEINRDFPDDDDPIVPPITPGDNGNGNYDPDEEGKGSGGSSDNQVIIPALRDNWWTQFREWLKRQIFVNP